MIINPIAAGIAGVQFGLGLLTGNAQQKQAEQDYLDRTVFQQVNTQFAQWQSSQSIKITNANQQYQYWVQGLQYNQNLAYVHQQQNYELQKQIVQADQVRDTRAAAGAQFAGNSQATADQYQQQGMAAAMAQMQYHWQALKGSAAVQAMDQEGNSIDRLMQDYSRQQGDYDTIAGINHALRTRQYNQEQTAHIGRYLSAYNSQTFYEPTVLIEPIAPFAPLPALLQPAAPTMIGAAPSNNALLNTATAGLDAFKTYTATKKMMG